jgi:hypothetical protein
MALAKRLEDTKGGLGLLVRRIPPHGESDEVKQFFWCARETAIAD